MTLIEEQVSRIERLETERNNLRAERDAALAEIDAISSAIKSPRYMDPPDGGSVTIAEQVARMWEENEALLARLAPVEDEPRHLTTDEQKVFHSALRRSAKIKKPVQDEALVEIGIGEIERGNESQWHFAPIEAKNDLRNRMRNAIAAIRPHIEAAERERCAKVAEIYIRHDVAYCHSDSVRSAGYVTACRAIAAAIRSGK